MPRVVTTPGVPLHVWAGDCPDAALRQLESIAAQPYVVGHVAAMPDVHFAEGVAVGTVFATRDALVPSVLGSDLGCGMAAVHFEVPAASLSRQDLQELLRELSRRLSGKKRRQEPPAEVAPLLAEPLSTRALEHDRDRFALPQLGTVGGGNHFVELDRDMAGDLWVLVHSGSRGTGGALGAHHAKAARAQAGTDLPHLRADSEAGQAFLHDLAWGLRYAQANRDQILAEVTGALEERLGALAPSSRLDLPHNFVAQETHAGEALWIHRKGAAAAQAGSRVLIPGSMGTASYIVEGLGNPDSFGSCSHGAGRLLSRREAREQIKVGDLERSMRRVVFDERLMRALVEEAPAAYRDIGEVLASQADLVAPVLRLEPLAVHKGS